MNLIEFVYLITTDGIQYPLFGGRRALLGWMAFGMPPLHYISDRGPNQHGITIRDFRADERVIDLMPYERGCARQDYWDSQALLSEIVRPNRGGDMRLLVVLPDYSEREIGVTILEGPRGDYDAAGNQFPGDVRERLRLLAQDPMWRDPAPRTVQFTTQIGESCLPMCLPQCIGSDVVISIVDVVYPGSWLSYPTIVMRGPLSEPTIENLTTGEVIQMDYNISDLEEVTISLGENIDTVTNNFGANLIGTVATPNDLATFHIEVDPKAPGGLNQFQVTGHGASALTEITMTYYVRYMGVPR